MTNDATKYIREVANIATSLRKMVDATGTDPAIPQEMREDLRWELSRLSFQSASTMAAMVRAYARYSKDQEP